MSKSPQSSPGPSALGQSPPGVSDAEAATVADPDRADSMPRVRPLAWLLVVGGALGFLAAFVLTVEKFKLVADPDYVPSCSFNPVLACGSVMEQPQAEAFGFPNPLLGIAGFAVVVTLGVLLLAGMALPRWIWIGLEAGTIFGVLFIHYLVGASLYSIHALCPYCMVVWAVMIPIFWYVTLYNLTGRNIPVPRGLRGLVRGIAGFHWVILLAWFAIIIALIADAFWDYWVSLF